MRKLAVILLFLLAYKCPYAQDKYTRQWVEHSLDSASGKVINDSIPYDDTDIDNQDNKFDFYTVFMPGLAYSYFQPKAADSLGRFSGISIEYLLYASVHENNNPGPSHFRVYLKFNILNSDKTNIHPLFGYTVGTDLSLEKNPHRTFLVPYFGLEMGEIEQIQLGYTFQFTPIMGLHILSHKNIFINVHGGYIYPVKNFEQLQGWFGQAGIDFALW